MEEEEDEQQQQQLDGCIVWNSHNTIFGWKRSAISNRWFLGPTLVLNANGISIASAVFPSRFTFDRGIAERVDTAKSPVK